MEQEEIKVNEVLNACQLKIQVWYRIFNLKRNHNYYTHTHARTHAQNNETW
jgi:hypothetical protein